MTRNFNDTDSSLVGATVGVDVTPSTTAFGQHLRAVTVSDDGATITGELFGNEGVSFTTHGLAFGIMHPYWFTKITAVSAGTVKGYY